MQGTSVGQFTFPKAIEPLSFLCRPRPMATQLSMNEFASSLLDRVLIEACVNNGQWRGVGGVATQVWC